MNTSAKKGNCDVYTQKANYVQFILFTMGRIFNKNKPPVLQTV